LTAEALAQEVLKEFVQGETLGFPGAGELFREYGVPFDPDGAFRLVAVRPDRTDPSHGSTVPRGLPSRSGNHGSACVLSVDGVELAVLQGETASREAALVQSWKARTSGVVAVSGRLPRADAIPAAFSRLRDRIRMGFLSSPGEVVRLSDEEEPETGLEYPSEAERRILQSLRAGDSSAAEDALESFLDALSGKRFDPFRFALRRLYASVRELERELRSDPGPAGSDLDGLPSEPTSLEEILDPFRNLFNSVREALEEHRAARCRELAEAVRSILRVRYTDPNLTLRSIADELGYSSSHVARAFKEGTGSSVADAILEYRLEAAKRLLLEDGCPAKDIAARVGLVNENYFYTLFRKKVGLTPAAYRRGGLQNPAETGNAGI
ncbi:MAG TPA: helix-turn-helix domain-containing protein, partial [Spirochaetia bacterium]|nr:helix-turn-helix domain-containing protein [Spirochaetia bacterium]